MGWFSNQIEERRQADRQALEDAVFKVSEVVLGHQTAERISEEQFLTKSAVDEILQYYHLRPLDSPETNKDIHEELDECLRVHHILRRTVTLRDGWYRDAFGPMLAFTKEGGLPVALLPAGMRGYTYLDPQTQKKTRVNRKNAEQFDTEALCFYRSLPNRKLTLFDLIRYIRSCIRSREAVLFGLVTLGVAAVGLLLPRITKALTGPVLASGRLDMIPGAALCVLFVLLSSRLLGIVKALLQKRLEMQTTVGLQAAMIARLLSLPVSFFRKYSPGDLKSRVMALEQICTIQVNVLLSGGLTALVSLLYILQIIRIAPSLALPSFLILLLTVDFWLVILYVQTKRNQLRMAQEAKESGLSYALISGVQKLKLAGAEKRAFAKWLNLYADGARLSYDPPLFLKLYPVISMAITLFSTILLYYVAAKTRVEPSSYLAFAAAYGLTMGAFLSLPEATFQAAQIKPILELAKPILETEPETAEGKEPVRSLSGAVELEHVSFRYGPDRPYILKDLSLKIRRGEYVAIVGRTGCGKSTLLRLLLGFETPELGAVIYDRKNLKTLDLPSLRRKIGVVTQDGSLFHGSIYANIVVAAPELDLDAAWEAAEIAGIADDIRAMPMGMYTVISEGSGSISGGQKQRIMIARAIAPKPKLLLLDEATSALDNKTQKQISEALDKMGCTRIVVAHRLSTIINCSRILVLDGGRIIEDGTYDELMTKDGFFAELVKRQRLDSID